jgi:hypothetical protein
MRIMLAIVVGVIALVVLAYYQTMLVLAIVLPFLTVVAGIALFDILRK